MDSYPNYNPEDERSYPAAPKGAGSGPDGVPLDPDHNPPSGGYLPNDEQWAGGAAFPLSSPYTGMSSGEPPAPIFRPELDGPGVARGGFPSRTDVGARSKPTNRRRVLAGLAAFLLLVLVVGGLAFVLLGGGGGTGHPTANGGNSNGGGAPVIVGTDTPTVTPTLLPGQTPLPTAIPATPTPVLAPGQPTPTPLPFASSASVSFTRATQSAVLPSSTLTAAVSGGQIAAHNPTATQTASVTESPIYVGAQPQTFTVMVTNTQGGTIGSPVSSATITSKDGFRCILQGFVQVTQGTPQPQQCLTTPAGQIPPTTWADSTSNQGLTYTASTGYLGSNPYYQVPQNCSSYGQFVTNVHNAVQSSINQALGIPGGASVFDDSGYSYGNITCSPDDYPTQHANAFSITVSISNSTRSVSYYMPGDAVNYQKSHVSADQGWQLLSSGACASPNIVSHTPTSATLSCPASGTEAWNAFNLAGMAALIHGQTQVTAKGELNAVQGVVANSETFSLSGGSYLPTNANNISLHYSP